MATNHPDPESYSGTTEPQKPSRQQLFTLISNVRRRRVLAMLTADDDREKSDLADQIAAEENGCRVLQLSGQQRKRVYISLHQSHLPDLAAAGAIDYDADRGTVGRGEHFWAFADVLDATADLLDAHDLPEVEP